MTELALDPDLVTAAARRLRGIAHRTPAVTSRTLNVRVSATVFCKCENLQRTGSFKFRGAYNTLAALPEPVGRGGVCTVSSGNHAQAVALAAALLGIPATVLMPEDAPPAKLAAVRGYGAEVLSYDRQAMPQWQAGEQLAAERGLPFISSHDDPLISAGAGTAVTELLEDAGAVDMLIGPVGGGGGMAGYATALRAQHPDTELIAAEPASSGLLAASLAAQARLERPVPATIADGLQLTRLGALPFTVLTATVDRVVAVSEEQILFAMVFAFERLKLVLEPSGAISLAALLFGNLDTAGRRIGLVLSGGNIATSTFAALLNQQQVT